MARRGGNSTGSSPDDGWGPTDLGEINSRANRGSKWSAGFTDERTVVDSPRWASDARIRRTSAQLWNGNPYTAGNGRKG